MKNQSSNGAAALHTDRFLAGCGFFVFALTAAWAAFFVPMNMDEAGTYHYLACANYPFARFNIFRDACGTFDIETPGGITIYHPGVYSGLWHTALYAPFYFLFHAPAGQYVFGLCLLIAFAALLARATAKVLLSLALVLSFFPFVFQFMHDTGPVTYALLMFPLSALLLQKLMRAPAPVSYGYAVAAALLILTAIEEKPFFLYLLPSAVFFAFALVAGDERFKEFLVRVKNARGALLAAVMVVVAGTLLLFFSTTRQGGYYIFELIALAQKTLSIENWFSSFVSFLLYWPSFAGYTFDLSDDYLAVILKLVTLGCFVFCAAVVYRRSRAKLRLLFLILSFASSVVVFFLVRNTWAGHHFIFLWVPLIMIFIDSMAILTPSMALGIAAGFLALNLSSVALLTQTPVQTRHSSEREAIFHFFNDDARASQAIINFSSWGGYYIQSIYGPKNQLVTYTEPFDTEFSRNLPLMPEVAKRLLAISHETSRMIYDVCYGPLCNTTALETAFGNELTFADALPGLADWHVFAGTPKKR